MYSNRIVLYRLYIYRLYIYTYTYLVNSGSEALTKKSDRKGRNIAGLSRTMALMLFNTMYCVSRRLRRMRTSALPVTC
jgi:hypothetical protein